MFQNVRDQCARRTLDTRTTKGLEGEGRGLQPGWSITKSRKSQVRRKMELNLQADVCNVLTEVGISRTV